MIKGSIEARDGESDHLRLGPKDSFNSRALVHGAAGETFVAAEETLCFLIPRDVVLGLLHRIQPSSHFFTPTCRASSMLADARKSEGVESVLRSCFRDTRYGAAVFVDGAATIEHQRIEVAAMYY